MEKVYKCSRCSESIEKPLRIRSYFCAECQLYLKKNKNRECKYCAKPFRADEIFTQYCSKACSADGRKTGTVVKCATCTNEIYKHKYTSKRNAACYCSVECASVGQRSKMIDLNCLVCNEAFSVYPSTVKHSLLRGYSVKYCSTLCRDKDPLKREALLQMSVMQNKNKKFNKLEIAGDKIIANTGLTPIHQHLFAGKICVDLYVPEYKLVIEWWGDYWHGHNTKIKGTPDNRQKKRMALDISQRKYIEACGYKLLTFWEHEVYNEPSLVLQTILDYIQLESVQNLV